MLLDLIDLKRLRRLALYIGIIILMQTFQNLFLSRIKFLGVKVLFSPALIAAIGMLEGGVTGGYLGLLAGFLLDMSYPENTILFTVLFTVFGFFSGYISEYYINKRLFSYLFIAAAALLITSACQGIGALVSYRADIKAIVTVAFFQFAWSLPFSVPAYLMCKAVADS